MRLIGNKTHGDLAEIGIAEFIHQFMYDFDSRHVGKDLFRAKKHEEDIVIINEMTKAEIPVSLKAYGDGPLQLSTDKDSKMFPKLSEYGTSITDKEKIREIFSSDAFQSLASVNVMPLIYRENKKECNIMVFDFDKMKEKTKKILLVDEGYKYDEDSQEVVYGGGRSHPIYMFIDGDGSMRNGTKLIFDYHIRTNYTSHLPQAQAIDMMGMWNISSDQSSILFNYYFQ